MVVSKSRIKDGPSKVKIRPILLKDKFIYQATETVGPKVLHTNYERQELMRIYRGIDGREIYAATVGRAV